MERPSDLAPLFLGDADLWPRVAPLITFLVIYIPPGVATKVLRLSPNATVPVTIAITFAISGAWRRIVALLVYRPKAQLLLASNAGRGFAAEADELLAETRKGRGVMTTKPGVRLAVVREILAEHDHVAVVGDNHKLVVFNLEELPVLAKGQGVTLQRYRDGGLSDATTLKLDEGLSWKMGGETGRTRTEPDVLIYKVARGAAGRIAPRGFPQNNKF